MLDEVVVERLLKSLIDNGMLPGDALRYVERSEMRAALRTVLQRRGIMPKPNQDLPDDGMTEEQRKKAIREGTYVPASGGISPGAHPGGIAPTEDPRKDAGLEPPPPVATPKK